MTERPRTLLHATCIAIEGRAALIVGPSGSGKSDLALRLAMTPLHDHGRLLEARLVADDQVVIERIGGRLVASPPATLAGLIEVRGLGIVTMPYDREATVHLVADLTPGQPVERLPDPPDHRHLLEVDVPLLRLDAYEAGAAAKLAIALLRTGAGRR